MAKGERKRTMVYSNVNKKKADFKSASKGKDSFDFDDEVFIGVKSFPKPNEINNKKKNGVLHKKNDKKQSNKEDDVNEIEKIKDDLEQEEVKNTKKVKKIIVNDNVKKTKLTKEQKIRIQKMRIIKRLGIVMLMLLLLIGGTIYFILSPAFNVKSIDVENNSKLSKEQIVSMSEISLNKNTFKFSKREVKDKLLTNPYIEDVNVTRNIFSGNVKIDVKERVATLMLEYGNSYVYINNQGYILEISPIKIDSPIIKGYVTHLEDVKPGNRLSKDDLERLEVVLKIIETAQSAGIEDLITQIDIKNKKDFIIVLESEDKTIYLGNCADLSTQMLYIKEMLQREKGIEGEFFIDMDLNTGNPVFREKV